MFIPIGTEEPSPRRRFPVVTVTIVALNVLVFLVEASVLFEGGEGALRRLINAWGAVPAAIAGVLGGYLLLFPRGIVRMFLLLGPFIRITRVPALLFILFWFLTQFLNGVASLGVVMAETGGVAYWAHVGGFAGGLVVMWLYKQLADRR
jgi:membrane associated rhomboid family serine protease